MLHTLAPMTQLVYEPAYDAYHAIFRLIRLANTLPPNKTYRVEKIRILDFFLLFPYLLSEVRLKPTHRGLKKIGENYTSRRPYSIHPSSQIIFSRMSSYQHGAITTLAAKGVIDGEMLQQNFVNFDLEPAPENLLFQCIETNRLENDLMEVITTIEREYTIGG